MKRIQMVGTQRSGSNLLRLMLDLATSIAAPPSVHLLRVFGNALPTYGDLAVDANRRALLLDVEELIRRNVLSWPDGPPDLTSQDSSHLRSAVDLLFFVYDLEGERTGADHWACKSLENLTQMNTIYEADPDLRFVHLLRDGRDVALSFSQAPIGPKNPLVQARKWVAEQRTILDFRGRHPEAVLEVRYEDLVATPQKEIDRLLAGLGVEPVPDIQRFFESDMAQRTRGLSDLWTNLTQPLLRDNFGKYMRPEHRGHTEAFEIVAHDALIDLGYEPVFPAPPSSTAINWRDAEQDDDQLRRARAARNAPDTEALHNHYEEFVSAVESRTEHQVGIPTATRP